MKALPQFEVYDDGDQKIGSFNRDDSDHSIEELFMDAEDYFYEYEFKKSKELLNRIILKDPLFHEAYLLLSSLYATEENFEEAKSTLKKGINIWESRIPEDFKGEIPWGILENRPYLTLLYKLSDLADIIGNTDESIQIAEKLLKYNPNDNQGVRWFVGNLYLKTDNYDKAEKNLKKTADEYPPNRYSYALLLFLKKQRWDTITQLRLAFIENIYIYEHLSFKAPIIPYDMFESSNLHGIEEASRYLEMMGHFWMQQQEALFFMEQVIKHPTVIFELNNIFNLKHELNNIPFDLPFDEDYSDELDDRDIDFLSEAKDEIFNEIQAAKKRINTTSSKKILKELDDYSM